MKIFKEIITDFQESTLIQKMLIVFIAMQPLLEVQKLTDGAAYSILGFAPSTIIRVGFISVVFVYLLLKNIKEKMSVIIVLFLVAYGIYVFIHLYAMNQFNTQFPDSLGYSITTEVFYLYKMILPAMFFYILKYSQISFKKLINALFLVSIQFSLVLLFQNLTKTGVSAYKDEAISISIFEWIFSDNLYAHHEIAMRGLFTMTNLLAVTYTSLTLIVYYRLRNSKAIYLFMVIHMLVCFIIGTKAAVYGFILLLFFFMLMRFLFYLFNSIIKKKYRIKWKKFVLPFTMLLIITVSYTMILPKSPVYARQVIEQSRPPGSVTVTKWVIPSPIEGEKDKQSPIKDYEEFNSIIQQYSYEKKIEFIEKNISRLGFPSLFIEERYSYKYDPDFWLDLYKLPSAEKFNFRLLEVSIMERVSQNDGREINRYVGIGYSRMNTIFNVERDYLSQYYSIGWVGTVFVLLPYIFMMLFSLRRFKLLRFSDTIVLCLVFFILGVAYYSGNILDYTITGIIIATCFTIIDHQGNDDDYDIKITK